MALKIIFAGTAEFALPSLQYLYESQHKLVAIYTQPDRRAGRGQKLTPSPIKRFAVQHGLSVIQPPTLTDDQTLQRLQSFNADMMITAAYGLLLPKAVLQMFKYGCINVHPSLLPKILLRRTQPQTSMVESL